MGMSRLNNQCSICSAPRAADRDYLLICLYKTSIGSHKDYFASYFGALPKDLKV